MFNQPFAAIPNKIAQWDSLGPVALAVITYVLSHDDDWGGGVSDIRWRFKLGDRAWSKVTEELKALGLLVYEQGKNGTQLHFTDVWKVANNLKGEKQ